MHAYGVTSNACHDGCAFACGILSTGDRPIDHIGRASGSSYDAAHPKNVCAETDRQRDRPGHLASIGAPRTGGNSSGHDTPRVTYTGTGYADRTTYHRVTEPDA